MDGDQAQGIQSKLYEESSSPMAQNMAQNLSPTMVMNNLALSVPSTGSSQRALGQCVYMMSPNWHRGRNIFTASQGQGRASPGQPTLIRLPHPPLGYMRFNPYRPVYYPNIRTEPNRSDSELYPNNDFNPYGYSSHYLSGHRAPEVAHQTHMGSIYARPYFRGLPQVYNSSYNQMQWRLPFGPDNNKTPLYYEQQQTSSATRPALQRIKLINTSENGFMRSHTIAATETRTESPQLNVLDDTSDQQEGLDISEVVVQTSQDDTAGPSTDDERVTFSNIEEALSSIDKPILERECEPTYPMLHPNQPFLQMSGVPCPGLRVADEKQDEVIKAAKSLFSKRTRTLYHWLYPQTSKTKLKATVSAAWDTLADTEKQFYLSQVLGRFGLQASSLMINPQLDGIKGLPITSSSLQPTLTEDKLSDPSTEAQRAVDQLFASCEDSETWTSYPSSSSASPSNCSSGLSLASRSRSRGIGGHSDRRRRTTSRQPETGARARLNVLNTDQLDEEVSILKQMREAKLEAELEEDVELSSELEKFRLLAQDSDRSGCRDGDDFWRRTPDPEDIFTDLDF